MKQDDVIRLARKAGIPVGICAGNPSSNDILAFAKLVAAHEREQCARAVDEIPLFAVGDMREFENETLQDAARTIRARGVE